MTERLKSIRLTVHCKFVKFYMLLAVITRPPDGDLSRFALEFCRPLRASVRSFISIHQVAASTALYCCC